jgi:hypothetical protein
VVSSRVDLKALGPIVPNCAPRLSYQLSAVQVHTTTYCMYREQHWAPHLLRPVLVSSSIIHIGILTTDYTPMTPPPPPGYKLQYRFSLPIEYDIQGAGDDLRTVGWGPKHAHNHKSTEDDNVTIKKLGHNIVLKEIQHLTGMTHCASFSRMEQFGSRIRGTVNYFTPPAILKIFL